MARPTIDSLRKYLGHILVDSTDVDMLFIDHFQQEREFTARGMSYHELINTILTRVSPERILEALRHSELLSKKADKFLHVLDFGNNQGNSQDGDRLADITTTTTPDFDIYKTYSQLLQISYQELQAGRAELPTDKADLYSPPEIIAMEIALAIERGEKIPYCLNSIICSQQLGIDTSQRHTSPFQLAGALSSDAICYMPRSCDTQIRSVINSHPLFAIWGSFQIGKTSLLLRMPQMLGTGWLCVVIDIMSFTAHNTPMFTKKFFGIIAKHTHARISDWSDLADFSHRQPLAILIDEIGALNTKIAQEILPRLRWLAENCKETIRIGCTMPQRTHAYFQSIELLNPKDRNYWKSIEVGPCGITQVEIIMSCLPDEVRLLARKFGSDILKHSKGMPVHIQIVCDKLFHISREQVPDLSSIQSLISQPSSYESN